MPTLLHIDTSLNGDASVSREVTRVFREAWLEQHPGGTVIYRDLAAEPLPHVTALAYHAQFTPPEERTPEQQAAFALRDELTSELESADAVVIGAPLYNYTIPSALKVWLDNVIILGRTTYSEPTSVEGKPVTVVSSRGGSYAPGTPMEGKDFNEPYLTHTLGGAMKMQVGFVIPELTIAHVNPAMAHLVDKAVESRAKALDDARAAAKVTV